MHARSTSGCGESERSSDEQNHVQAVLRRIKSIADIDRDAVDAWMARRLACSWSDFDEFKREISLMYCVHINEANFKRGQCSCPWFAKHNVCKHMIGLSSRCNIAGAVIPREAKLGVAIGEKRKAGRPAKSKKALLVQ